MQTLHPPNTPPGIAAVGAEPTGNDGPATDTTPQNSKAGAVGSVGASERVAMPNDSPPAAAPAVGAPGPVIEEDILDMTKAAALGYAYASMIGQRFAAAPGNREVMEAVTAAQAAATEVCAIAVVTSLRRRGVQLRVRTGGRLRAWPASRMLAHERQLMLEHPAAMARAIQATASA